MTDCDVCKILHNKDSFKLIYEDEICFVILHESPAIEGHSLVIPKKHVPILEELDDKITGHIFNIANKISTSIFETLGSSGTNIMINNGISAGQELPHVLLNVLPRKENDGINLEWPAKKASDGELKTAQSIIKSMAEFIFSGKDALPEIKIKKEERHETKGNEDYMIKHLKRLP